MKLSICMMVKNEESNLPRCLESLRTLRANIESELIIIDTGSEDNTVEIAKEYTSNVYYHKWDNNFAKMRNTSIGYAKGEWIFIIDADEELINEEEFIQFLNFEGSKSYVGAALRLRNIKEKDGKNYSSELITTRIFRNKIGAHYEGSVHNRLVLTGEVLELKATLNHYGYIVDDEKLMERKFQRTKLLLEKELKKDPKNVYYLYQLSTSYGMYQKWEDAYTYSSRAYELIHDSKTYIQYPFAISEYIKNAFILGKYDEVIKASKKAIGSEPDFVDIYFYLAGAYGQKQLYDDAIQTYRDYLACLKRFPDSQFRVNPSIQHYTLDKENEAMCNLTILLYLNGEFEDALIASERVLEQQNTEISFVEKVIPVYVKCSLKLMMPQKLDRFSNHQYFNQVRLIVEETLLEIELDKRKIAIDYLSNENSSYGFLNKLRSAHMDKQVASDLNVAWLKDCIQKQYRESLYFGLLYKLDLAEDIFKLDEVDAMKMLGEDDEQHEDLVAIVSNYDLEIKKDDSYQRMFFKRLLLKYLFIKHINQSTAIEFFDRYIQTLFAQVKAKYCGDYLKIPDFDRVTNKEEKLAIMIQYVINSKNHNYLSDICNIFTEWNPSILKWIDFNLINDSSLSEEMMDLKHKLLNNINVLVDLGKLEDASSLLNEAQSIFSNDIDLILLKSKIKLH